MNNFKFTGTNIAAALLILFYFFSWIGMPPLSLSGFNISTNGVSPGLLANYIPGIYRILMILFFLVPLSGALILYQNITGNNKFSKYYKPAHVVPAVLIVLGIILLYFKMQPETSRYSRMSGPGITDILCFGIYASLALSIYLLLVGMGKVKDKEYYKPGVDADKINQNINLPGE